MWKVLFLKYCSKIINLFSINYVLDSPRTTLMRDDVIYVGTYHVPYHRHDPTHCPQRTTHIGYVIPDISNCEVEP